MVMPTFLDNILRESIWIEVMTILMLETFCGAQHSCKVRSYDKSEISFVNVSHTIRKKFRYKTLAPKFLSKHLGQIFFKTISRKLFVTDGLPYDKSFTALQ